MAKAPGLQHFCLMVLESNSGSLHSGWAPSANVSLTFPSRKGWGWMRHPL